VTPFKYNFVIHPGADPSQIQLNYQGQNEVFLNKGEIVIVVEQGVFAESIPFSYTTPSFQSVDVEYYEVSENNFSFNISSYDTTQVLIIDPIVRKWGTYYGGSDVDEGLSVSTDLSGNVYLAGHTKSSNNIATALVHQVTYDAGSDGFVAKFNINGVRQWGTYYGNNGGDQFLSSAVDLNGNIYAAGYTSSGTGISHNGHQNIHGGGTYDAFLVKLHSSGIRIWATYYGGTSGDYGFGCTVDLSGNVYLAGHTESNIGIATPNSYQATRNGSTDAFLVKFSSTGARAWGTYFGGNQIEWGSSCATDQLGNVYLAGHTASTSNIAHNGHQDTHGGGGYDAYLVKFNPSGSRLWATYYGGSNGEYGYSCCTDLNNNVYLVGDTYSNNGIHTAGTYQNILKGNVDAFLVKFNPSGNRLWGTYFGGTNADFGASCRTRNDGNVYLAGWTNSTNIILPVNSHQPANGGGLNDAYLFLFNSNNGQGMWGTYYGGNAEDIGKSCTTDNFGNVYLTGRTLSNNNISFPVPGAHQTTRGGNSDGFLVKFSDCSIIAEFDEEIVYICEGESVQLVVNVSAGNPPYTYQWSPQTGINNPNIYNPIASPATTTTYIVTATDINGCTATAQVTVHVFPNPDIPILGGPNYTCMPDDTWIIQNYNSNYTYDWHVVVNGNQVSSSFNGGSTFSYDWMNNFPNGGQIQVVVTDPVTNCFSETYLNVYPCCDDNNIFPNVSDYIWTDETISTGINYSNEVFIINGDVVLDGQYTFTSCTFYLAPYSSLILDSDNKQFLFSKFTNCRDTVWKEIHLLDKVGEVAFRNNIIEYSKSGIVNDVGRVLSAISTRFFNNFEHGIRLSNFNNLHQNMLFSGNVFSCTSPADMIFPYQNMRPEKGMYLNNNFITNGEISIGPNNTFSNIISGVYSIDSDVNVYGCSFINMNTMIPFQSSLAGVYAESPQKTQTPNRTIVYQNIFNNCLNGVWIKNNINSEISNNSLVNPVTSGMGVKIEYMNNFGNAVISNNTIQNLSIGIFANSNSRAAIQIFNNNISWDASLSGGSGMRLVGGQFASEVYWVENNKISRPNDGVFCLNLFNPILKGNVIEFLRVSSANVLIPRGIYLQNNIKAIVISNTISGTGNPSSVVNIGIHFVNSSQSKITCNRVLRVGSCIRASGACYNSRVEDNSFSQAYEGLSLYSGGIIGQQGSPTYPSDNRWMPNLNAWNNKMPHFTHFSFGNLSPLHVRNGITTNPSSWAGNTYPGTPFSEQFTIIPGADGTPRICFYQIGPKQGNLAQMKQLMKEEVDFPVWNNDLKAWNKRHLIGILPFDTVAVADPEVAMFLDTIRYVAPGQLDSVQKMTDLQLFVPARNLLYSIIPVTEMDSIEVSARYLQLKTLEEYTITDAEIGELVSIAHLCPYTDGQGVYIARAILASHMPDVHFENMCEIENIQGKQLQIEPMTDAASYSFNVFPNPSSDCITIEQTNEEIIEFAIIQMYDVLGRIVLEAEMKDASQTKINIMHFENGIYLLRISDNQNNLLYKNNIVVIK
jgi:hypothetical protein